MDQKVERDGKSLELGAFPAEPPSLAHNWIKDDLIIAPLLVLCFHIQEFTLIKSLSFTRLQYRGFQLRDHLDSGTKDG